jgi:hypothetical protein
MAGLLQDVLDGHTTADDIVCDSAGWASDDPVIWGVLDELHNLDGSLHGDDCRQWDQCDDFCNAYHKLDPKRVSVKCSNAKREIARAIEFLKTDCVYRWDEGLRMPWWMSLLAAVVLIVGATISIALAFPLSEFLCRFGIKLDEPSCMFVNCIVFAFMWLSSMNWLANKALGKDRRYWPYYGPNEWNASHNSQDLL